LSLVKRAIKSGDIRKDLDAIDLLRALIGVNNMATSPDWQESARRLVDILITVRGQSNRLWRFEAGPKRAQRVYPGVVAVNAPQQATSPLHLDYLMYRRSR
jgi:hypothetical protein